MDQELLVPGVCPCIIVFLTAYCSNLKVEVAGSSTPQTSKGTFQETLIVKSLPWEPCISQFFIFIFYYFKSGTHVRSDSVKNSVMIPGLHSCTILNGFVLGKLHIVNIFLLQCYQCFITSVVELTCVLFFSAAAVALECNLFTNLACDYADPLLCSLL